MCGAGRLPVGNLPAPLIKGGFYGMRKMRAEKEKGSEAQEEVTTTGVESDKTG